MRSNDAGKQYLHEIKKALSCDSTQKKRYIAGLHDSIELYLSEHPDAGLEDLYAVFGTPRSFVADWLNNADVMDISQKISRKRFVSIGVIVIVAILAIAIGVTTIVFFNDIHYFHQGYEIETVVELPSVVEPSPLTVN